MYALPLTITLLSVIALAHGGTLRQYGRDWLIPKPAPQVDAKRITAKSVFVAPSFGAAEQHVRCGVGFRQDAASGRCVKVVHVNQAAQLDFLLQRLNAMYGSRPGLDHHHHSETQPLQVAVGIPVEPTDSATPADEGGVYGGHVKPPEGEVSIDLLVNVTKHSTKDPHDAKTQDQNVAPQLASVTESEGNETLVMPMPNEQLFHVDGEPIVILVDGDGHSTTLNTPLDTKKSSFFDGLFSNNQDPDKPVSIDSEDDGLMAVVTKNESNMIKKATFPGEDSVHVTSESESNIEPGPVIVMNETKPDSLSIDKPQQTSKNSTLSDDTIKEISVGDEIVYSNGLHEDVGNEVNAEGSVTVNGTSFKVSDVTPPTSLLTSDEEALEWTTVTWIANETTISSSTGQEETTLRSKLRPSTTGLPNSTTNDASTEHTLVDMNDTKANVDHVDDFDHEYFEIDTEHTIRDVDLEVDFEDLEPPEDEGVDAGEGDSKPTEVSAIASVVFGVNDSVETNGSQGLFDSGSGDGGISEHEYSGDSEDASVSFNQSVYLDSMKTVNVTEMDSSYKLPDGNGTKFVEILSFSEATGVDVERSTETLSYGDRVDPLSSSSTTVTKLGEEVLQTESAVHVVGTGPHSVSENFQPVSEATQQVITPEHSVRVIYPQSIIQVLNVKQDPHHGHGTDAANTNESKIKLEETALNSSPAQFHHTNRYPPPTHHNSHPLPHPPPPVESLPEGPHRYNGFHHPPQHRVHRPNVHPQPHRPYQHVHPHPRPQHHPPRPHGPPADGHGGFVRFPPDRVQEFHRSQPHKYVEAGNAVRFPQEDPRTNDKYSRWGNWEPDEGRGRVPEQRHWAAAENRRNYNRPVRRRPQLAYY